MWFGEFLVRGLVKNRGKFTEPHTENAQTRTSFQYGDYTHQKDFSDKYNQLPLDFTLDPIYTGLVTPV